MATNALRLKRQQSKARGAACLINAAQFLAEATSLIVISDPGGAVTLDHVVARTCTSLPASVLSVIASGNYLSAARPAAGKIRIDSKTTAYICHGPVCSAPLTDAQAFRDYLTQR